MDEKIYYPEFLNSCTKWIKCIHDMNTVDKFEEVMQAILKDENVSITDFYIIMKLMERDLELVHQNKNYSVVVKFVEALLDYYHYQLKKKKE